MKDMDTGREHRPDLAHEADRDHTRAYGTPTRSAYLVVIGDAPVCAAREYGKAAAYLKKIEHAIDLGGWSGPERTRLYRLRDKWKARADGTDPRFNVAGTQPGRLKQAVEMDILDDIKAVKTDKAATSRTRDRRRKQHDWSQWEDMDAPFGKAKGGPGGELEGDSGEEETGEPYTPKRLLTDRDFIVPGQDSKGHSHRIYCKVMPSHFRALNAIYMSKKYPFRTVGDIMRWGVDRAIRDLGKMLESHEIQSYMLQVDAVAEILASERHQQDFAKSLEDMATTINSHLAAQAVGEARRTVAMVKAKLDAMPDGYWKDRYLEKLKQQFGHLLDGTQNEGVSLLG